MEFNLSTPQIDERPVFITGNFNDWNPNDPKYIMEETAPGVYELQVNDEILPKKIEYKYTKGGWSHVELDKNNEITANRKIKRKTDRKTEDFVPNWRLNWGPFKEEFYPIVHLIDEEFYIPQLDKTRKVWALLPHDYFKTDRHYPVLYLQDAQNLFSENAPFGDWEIDKKLSILAEYGRGDLIVIAVEHGGKDRIKEYVFQNPRLTPEAEGKKYVRFMADTLKPYVDRKYRTLKDRENTGIGGSSLGALISIYAGFLYPEVYSKLMIFSPSLWVTSDGDFPLMNFAKPFKTKVWLYGGLKEGDDLIKRMHAFERYVKRLEKQKMFDFEVSTSINPEGKHSEFYWAQEFPKAVEWLFFDSPDDPLEILRRRHLISTQKGLNT